jgi:hypothetical protein
VKKKLEDYDQMLQYYIIMITKNKMKDSDVEFKEWWKLQKNIFSRNWKTIERNIELMKKCIGTN